LEDVSTIVTRVEDLPRAQTQAHELTADVRAELAPLAAALLARTDELIEDVTARAHHRRAQEDTPTLDGAVEGSFVRLGALATIAVARWLSGEPIDVASAAGDEFSQAFAVLAACSDVPLGEVVRRCQYWRDRCDLALREASQPSGPASEQALSRAREAIQQSADRTIAQMSAIFDRERRRIKEELARCQAELSFLATHDGLTGLANRALIIESLKRMLARCARQRSSVAVLFIDLDDFKLVNDTLNHSVGDQLLVAIATRLREVVRDADTVGRFGGDELVVLAELTGGSDDPGEIVARVREVFAAPFTLEGRPDPLQITASIGVAIAQAGSSAEQLLCDADIAMYRAKSQAGQRDEREG
jgi:diguanylate cyclase (GGDEF)-like protein